MCKIYSLNRFLHELLFASLHVLIFVSHHFEEQLSVYCNVVQVRRPALPIRAARKKLYYTRSFQLCFSLAVPIKIRLRSLEYLPTCLLEGSNRITRDLAHTHSFEVFCIFFCKMDTTG